MQFSHVSRMVANCGIRALVLVAVAAAGIAVGRWVVPAGDPASSASLEATGSNPAISSESVAPDAPAEGQFIGVRFQTVAPPSGDASGVDGLADPKSPADGHVIGVRFR